jgi:predicted nucleotidyltransferase component of viral defense system
VKTPATRDTSAGRTYLDLKNLARKTNRKTGELLELYALEGFLARLSLSPYQDQFILKGGALLAAYDERRPTQDVDFSARQITRDMDRMLEAMRDIADTAVDDGLVFDTVSAKVQQIRDEAEYPGTRVSMKAALVSAQLSFHIDISVGDPVWPDPQVIALPRLLGGHVRVIGYPLVMVFAEKICACVQKSTTNTRWRDFADIRNLSRRHDVTGRELCMSISKVAEYQRVTLRPLSGVLAGFADISQSKWTRWRQRMDLEESAPADFTEVLDEVIAFADPVLTWDADGLTWRAMRREWIP